MDQAALVVDRNTLPIEQRDGGEKLIRRLLADGFDLSGAVWTAINDDHQPYLYLVTPEVGDRDPRPAYAKVATARIALDRDGLPWDERLDHNGVKLIPPDRPLARGVASYYARDPASLHPAWRRAAWIGPAYVDGAYIYPASLFRPAPQPADAAPPAGV